MTESASAAGLVSTTAGGIAGAAVGLALAAGLMVQQRRLRLRPLAWVAAALVVIPLYFVLYSVLFQIDSVILPPYLPAAWVKQGAAALLGFLLGGGIPLLLYTLVAEGYRLLD